MSMDIKKRAEELQPYLQKLRRDFHRHPETSFCERETAGRILSELADIGGYEIKKNVNGTFGIIAELKGCGDGDLTALRADMDALSIKEETGLDYASENPGVMHACGHDNHITMLLGAARLLSETKGSWKGTVRLIFQPAEELAPKGGSRTMIEGGALDKADHVFGLHVWPSLPTGILGVRDGFQMAASDHFKIHFEGLSSHAAEPEKGRDSLMAGVEFVHNLKSSISQYVSKDDPVVLTIGEFHAGTRYNIVAGSCDIEGTCRTYSSEMHSKCEMLTRSFVEEISLKTGCKNTFNWEKGYDALKNDPSEAAYMRNCMEQLFGSEAVTIPEKGAMTAEDFSFYLEHTPGAFGWIGTSAEGSGPAALHSSRYAPDEDVLWRGAGLLAALVIAR